ncbi:lytic murein transglycosylase [Patescibacteria group bacterium]|nr:lytic murein transglycosylase [Patescibacteria group bacterium]
MTKPTKIRFYSEGLAALGLLFFLLLPFFSQAANIDDLKKDLEEQIQQKQQEIDQYQGKIQENQQTASSLKNEIQLLENQISKVQLEINQIDLVIKKNTLDVDELSGQIGQLEDNMDEKKGLLAEYLRTVSHYDQETLLEVVLKNDKFSDFFEQVNALESAQDKIQTILASVREIKDELEGEREKMEEDLAEQNILKLLQVVQRKSVESIQRQKENLLKQTKGQETAYQEMIKDNQNDIVYIKEQLTLLEKYNLTLEEAVADAVFAASKTGLRPSFLLGVLEMESRLGINVGKGNWKKDMYQCYRSLGYVSKAEREKNAFFQVCAELGLNADNQPVSAEPYYGCGGAMGIAQFMPTTWLAYRDRISALTGSNPPNPWNPRDAFTAAAIKLADAGAGARTEYSERKAYAIYLAGSNYAKWINSSTLDKVIQYSNSFQQQYFQ